MKNVNWKEINAQLSQESTERRAERLTALHKLPFGESVRKRKRKGYKINPIFLGR